MGTLAEELASLANPAPVFLDPEDNGDLYTSAKLVSALDKDDDVNNAEQAQPSKLRQKAALVENEYDRKYAGKRTSRKKLKDEGGDFSDSSDESDDIDGSQSVDNDQSGLSKVDYRNDSDNETDEESDSDSEEDAEIESFQSKLNQATKGQQKSFSFVDDGDYSKYADDSDEDLSDESGDEEDEEEDDNDEESDDDDEINMDTSREKGDDEDGGVSSFSKTSADEEVQKGQAAKCQLETFDSLLEGRIKLQKIVTAVNQLPQLDTWRTFETSGGDKFCKGASSAQQMLKNLLDKLIQLQTVLLLQNQETRHVITGDKDKQKIQTAKSPKDDDDEEITSESEVEETESDIKDLAVKAGMKRKLDFEDYPDFLSKRHSNFQTFRNNTIKKWNDKTRLAGGKISSKSFSAFEQSALKQIEQIMSDKNRLIKRTQMKRSVYRVLGQTEEEKQTTDQRTDDTLPSEQTLTHDRQHEYNEEIFDDSDFYHQQLRELIERKTSDINDPVALSRQWLQIQKMRNKVKKNVDMKASKGRKLRYHVHSKLVNFMAPEDTCTWSDEAKTDLFSSLFGKRFQRPTESDISEDR